MSQFDNYLNYYESIKCAMQDHSNHSHPELENEEQISAQLINDELTDDEIIDQENSELLENN